MNTQEIIGSDEIHGFVFNMRTIEFNEDVCETMIKEELSDVSKREFVHALYGYALADENILQRKTCYGDCDVTFSNSIKKVGEFQYKILQKISDQITPDELEKYFNIMDSVVNFSPKEITQDSVQQIKSTLQNLIIPQPQKTPKLKA